MRVDDPPEPDAALHERPGVAWVIAARWPAVAALFDRGPWVLGGLLVGLVAVVAGVWWLMRPPPHPSIDVVLPRASAPTGATESIRAPASLASGVSGASGGTPTAGASGPSLVVHVIGAVEAPGVVLVDSGARVLDAVAAAGGLRGDADTARMNLAAKLVDGQRVVVPVVGEPVPAQAPEAGGANAGGATGELAAPIDLNQATAAELDALPGVGPSTAAAIVAHRTANGPFRSVDALGDVRGIGPAKLEQLRPMVTVS